MENSNTIVIGNVKLGHRTRLKLKAEELSDLKKFVDGDTSPYHTIKENTGITKDTINRILERGWANVEHALSLRLFIKSIKHIGLI